MSPQDRRENISPAEELRELVNLSFLFGIWYTSSTFMNCQIRSEVATISMLFLTKYETAAIEQRYFPYRELPAIILRVVNDSVTSVR